jgi:hypothetical protein
LFLSPVGTIRCTGKSFCVHSKILCVVSTPLSLNSYSIPNAGTVSKKSLSEDGISSLCVRYRKHIYIKIKSDCAITYSMMDPGVSSQGIEGRGRVLGWKRASVDCESVERCAHRKFPRLHLDRARHARAVRGPRWEWQVRGVRRGGWLGHSLGRGRRQGRGAVEEFRGARALVQSPNRPIRKVGLLYIRFYFVGRLYLIIKHL